MKLAKEDLVHYFAKRGYTKVDSRIIIDDFIDSVIEVIGEGNTLTLWGLGKFEFVEHKARENIILPTSGEIYKTEAHRAIKFRPGAKLKAAARSAPVLEE